MQHDDVAHHVLQLPHIAWPRIGQQPPLGLKIKAAKPPPLLARELRQELTGDQHHILPPLAQRRQLQRHDIEPVEQILAKPPRLHLGHRVAVGSADKAHLHLLGPARAHRLERAGLHEAQQLHLHVERHLADLIEEQRAAIGQPRRPHPIAGGAREGTFHMAEHLALQQIAWNGAAVQRDERGGAARTGAMHRLGRQFLAGAALAGDEHAGPARRHALDGGINRLHRGRGANEAMKSLPRHRSLTQRVAQGDGEALGVIRLGEIVKRAEPDGLRRALGAVLRGDDHHLHHQPQLRQAAQQINAAHPRQHHIQQHRRRPPIRQQIQRGLSRGNMAHRMAGAPQQRHGQRRLGRVILHHQNAVRCTFHPLSHPPRMAG